MKPYLSIAAFFILASFAADAAPVLDRALVKAVEDTFPDAVILAHSPDCKTTPKGSVQTGMILQQGKEMHAVIAIASGNHWTVSALPKRVGYARGAAANFLDEFNTAQAKKQMEVRCTHPNHDPDISTEAHGAFIDHRGEQASAKHLCFPASAVYNSWVCYWTKPGTTKPALSFVQFNAD